jgi:hypothetical protein
MMPRCAGRVSFIGWEREFLELNFIFQSISCVFSKGWEVAFNIFLAHVSQLHHIINDGIRRFRRRAPKKISLDGTSTNKGVKSMGELLEIASWVGTPLGGVVAVAFVAALFFYGRWVLAEPAKKKV